MRSLERILIADRAAGSEGRAAARVVLLGFEQQAATPELLKFGGTAASDLREVVGIPVPDTALDESRADAARSSADREALAAAQTALAIAAQAGACQADLAIVDGAMFSGAIDRESAIGNLIAAIDCPLLIVNREPVRRYESVLVATDFSEPSMQAARWALALTPSAYLVFLHAWERAGEATRARRQTDPSLAADTDQVRQTMNRFIGSLGKSRRMMARAIVEGPAAPTIATHAAHAEVDLIAFGRATRADHRGQPQGPVAQQLAACTDCDLLVVPSLGDDNDDHLPAA